MIFQLFVLKHLTKTLCLFFLCFRPCSMPKHTLPPYVPREYTEEYILSDFSNVFSQKILINCVSLFLMLFSMFRSESLAIACSESEHFTCLIVYVEKLQQFIGIVSVLITSAVVMLMIGGQKGGRELYVLCV